MALTRLGPNQLINLATNTTGSLNLTSQVTGTLPVANCGTALTSGFNNGKFGQIQIAERENEVDIYSSSYSLITGLSKTITPTATSSKVLILANLNGVGKHSGADRGGFRITRAGTELKVFSQSVADNNSTTTNFYGSADTIVYLDSPNSTSSLEYEVTGKRFNASGALRVNSNNGYSSLTLIEILA